MIRRVRNLSILCAAAGCLWAADTQRGAVVLEEAGCLGCHTVYGHGSGHEPSGIAPELDSNLVTAYTAPALASAVWNHTPAMLAETSAQRLNRPDLTGKDWEDLFAYLYSAQFLESPAEAGRGKAVFQSKQCAGCHAVADFSLIDPKLSVGKAVSDWQPVDDPVTLVYRMWSHASPMEQSGRQVDWITPGWTKMSGRDFADLTAYFQKGEGLRPSGFSLPDPATGKAAFDKNCGNCHAGPLALETLLANTTWMDIGAGMWNHVTLMRRVPSVNEGDMRKILAYVWELQYRGSEGNQTRGQQAFYAKGCFSCHGNRAVPRTVTPAALAAIGWGSGRMMHESMQEQGIAWPQLSPQEVADVAAYMNSVSGK